MDEKDLSALIEGEVTTPEPEDKPQSPPEGPARGPDGKFAAKAAETPPEAPPAAEAPPAPPSAPPAPEPGHVPISAMLDEREKRQALERQLAEIQAKQKEAQAQAQATELPADVRQAQQLWALRMDVSRELIASQVGEAEAQALHDWGVAKCDADPHFNAQVFASKNPYAFLRQARQREQLLAEVSPDDLDDYRAWKAAKAQGSQAPAPTPQPTPVPTPPRSLADAPNAGGGGATPETPMGPGAAFASTIRR
jgi:hypothetical protein